MHVTKKFTSDTKVKLTLTADQKLMDEQKQHVLSDLAKTAKIPGFRQGKVPAKMAEKYVDPARLQSEFLEHAVNRLYVAAVEHENLRPVANPEIKITKFVPFDTLEVEAEVEVVGEVKLADYKKIKISREKVSVDAKEIEDVIADLRIRESESKDVDRAAKNKDKVWIDFAGVDAKTKEPIKGADGKEYPLVLGSDTFIPGFEPELVGLKKGDEKTFTVTFPKDYGAKTLQNRKVEFTVKVNKVQEVVEPKVDDAFAAKIGPFKTVAELKDDIKKELTARKENDAELKFGDELLRQIASKSTVAIPESLVEEQLDRIVQEQRNNLMYRGMTWQEWLESQKLDEKGYRAQERPQAELRVKAGLVLSEIAEVEKIEVTPEELEVQIQILKARYPDQQMQAELAKPEGRRNIASRLMTDKTMAKLKEYARS